MDKTAILIAYYKVEVAIDRVVKDFKAAIPEKLIYIYNNNSTGKIDEKNISECGATIRWDTVRV